MKNTQTDNRKYESDETVIAVKDVHKKFKVYFDKGTSLKEKVLFGKRSRYEDRWVLKGINMDVKKGEAVGLVGQNGCGKSTLLKLMTRIMYPDKGSIEITGRVSSLIELGAGFHPDMSGRENIYTNAAIFGLTHKEIEERLQDIIEFSELGEYIDNPVRTYSSGMYMRLAFSVAINVDADVLLIDEILAVGDANFQAKCFNRMREIKAMGTTIVIVSHSLAQIEQICDRSYWIQDGLIQAEGAPRDVHPKYLEFMGELRQEIIEKEDKKKEEKVRRAEKKSEDGSRWGNGDAEITAVSTYNSKGQTTTVFQTGETVTLRVEYTVSKPVKDAIFGIAIYRNDGTHVYGTNTQIDKLKSFDLTGDGVLEVTLDRMALLPGAYIFDIAIHNYDGENADYYKNAHKIEMYSPVGDAGIYRIEHEWKW